MFRARHGLYISILVLAAIMAVASAHTVLAQGLVVGNRYIPESSLVRLQDIGKRAHTNIQILIGPPGGVGHPSFGAGPAGGLSPAQLRQAYNLPSVGGSQIIALVDAYDNPNALYDFNMFASQFGLPQEFSTNAFASTNKVFQVMYANGVQPLQDPSGDWEVEESLDVQWAHAMAPNAKIILVETVDQTNLRLFQGVAAATGYVDGNGWSVKEISNSWGFPEFTFETYYDRYLNVTGPVILASAGDSGAPTSFPTASPYVVSAGGTSVFTDQFGNFQSEAGWTDGGGGPSAVELIPSYQSVISGIVGKWRGTPDISYDADPNTGVSVYCTFPNDFFYPGWLVVGGTSVSSPALAGVANLAATQQGVFPTSAQQLLQNIYANYGTSNFRDITIGNNGYPCLPGWDFVTGVGSPLGLAGLQSYGIPVTKSTTVEVYHNTPVNFSLSASDPDTPPQTLKYTIVTPPACGTLTAFNSSTGAATYAPNANFQGTDTLTFTVSNLEYTSQAATVTLNVAPGVPSATPQSINLGTAAHESITLAGADPDSPPLTLGFAIAASPSHGKLSGFNAVTGAVTYTPASGFHGLDSFTFTVQNGSFTSMPATVSLGVAVGTPKATAQSVTVSYGVAEEITLAGTDPDTPPMALTFAIKSAPAHGVLGPLNASTGALTYTPNAGYAGTDSFSFTVSNGFVTSSAAAVSISVVTGTPTANPQSVSVAHNTAKAIKLTGSDPDSPPLPLTFAIAASPAHGTLSGLNTATGAVTYTPTSNFQGTDSFTFTVSNKGSKSAPVKVTITVAPGTPTASPQTVSVVHNTATKVTLAGTDPDSPALPLIFSLGTAPTHGTLSGLNASTGAVTYTPASGYVGKDSFTFKVSNGTNTSAPATVTITVAGSV